MNGTASKQENTKKCFFLYDPLLELFTLCFDLTHYAKDLTSTMVCMIPKFAPIQYHENKRHKTQILAFKVGACDESQPFSNACI
jgi:hypothetical protein